MTSLASFQGQLLKQESGQCDSCLSPGGRAVERGPEHWHSSGAGLGLCPREGGRESLPFSRASSPLHSPLTELKASRQYPNKWPLFLEEGEGKPWAPGPPVQH